MSAVFALVIVAPALGALMGVEPGRERNRTPAELPALSWPAAGRSATYAALERWLRDHLPGRQQAVRAASWVDYRVFGTTPNPAVVVGRGSWLFLREALQACTLPVEPRWIIDSHLVVSRALALTGRELRVLFVPDKAWMYESRLGPLTDEARCARERHRELRRLALRDPSVFIDLRRPLAAARRPTYSEHDSHWTDLGRLIAARTLVSALEPGVWDERDVRRAGRRRQLGDLTELIGLPWSRREDAWEVRRPGVTSGAPPGGGPPGWRHARSTGSRRLIERPTLFLHDSQMLHAEPMVRPHFARMRAAYWLKLSSVPGPGSAILDPSVRDSVRAARLLVVESVVRLAYLRTLLGEPYRLLAAVADELPASPLTTASGGLAFSEAAWRLVGSSAVVELAAGEPADDRDRLLVVPLRDPVPTELALRPADDLASRQFGVPFHAQADDRFAILWLPAGARLADVRLVVHGKPGDAVDVPSLVTLPPPS